MHRTCKRVFHIELKLVKTWYFLFVAWQEHILAVDSLQRLYRVTNRNVAEKTATFFEKKLLSTATSYPKKLWHKVVSWYHHVFDQFLWWILSAKVFIFLADWNPTWIKNSIFSCEKWKSTKTSNFDKVVLASGESCCIKIHMEGRTR